MRTDEKPVTLSTGTMVKLLVAIAVGACTATGTALHAYYGTREEIGLVRGDVASLRGEYGRRLDTIEAAVANLRAACAPAGRLMPALLVALLLAGCAAQQRTAEDRVQDAQAAAQVDAARHGKLGDQVAKAAATALDAPSQYHGTEQPPYFALIHGAMYAAGALLVVGGIVIAAVVSRSHGALLVVGGICVAITAAGLAYYGKVVALSAMAMLVLSMVGLAFLVLRQAKRGTGLVEYLEGLLDRAEAAAPGYEGTVLNAPAIRTAIDMAKPLAGAGRKK